jgi:hypothetical protein
VRFIFFVLSAKEFFLIAQYFLQRLSNPKTKIRMEEKMKKTNSMLSFLNAEVNVNIDVTANVKLVKMGGGGSNI